MSTTAASTTTQKHQIFVAEAMRGKPVTDLAGMGPILGERLKSKGFQKAYQILGRLGESKLARPGAPPGIHEMIGIHVKLYEFL